MTGTEAIHGAARLAYDRYTRTPATRDGRPIRDAYRNEIWAYLDALTPALSVTVSLSDLLSAVCWACEHNNTDASNLPRTYPALLCLLTDVLLDPVRRADKADFDNLTI